MNEDTWIIDSLDTTIEKEEPLTQLEPDVTEGLFLAMAEEPK